MTGRELRFFLYSTVFYVFINDCRNIEKSSILIDLSLSPLGALGEDTVGDVSEKNILKIATSISVSDCSLVLSLDLFTFIIKCCLSRLCFLVLFCGWCGIFRIFLILEIFFLILEIFFLILEIFFEYKKYFLKCDQSFYM